VQRRSLVSRRNTAKLRLRQKNERDYQLLIRVELDIIQEAVSRVIWFLKVFSLRFFHKKAAFWSLLNFKNAFFKF
jgi:hypothetical protein